MESLSGPLHSRKLSNGNGFFSKNAYDGLFSDQRKFGAPIFSAREEDYREIFGSSQGNASSVPVLHLSGFGDPNVSSNLRSSKPDYSKIFGGFRDDDGAVSYEELFSGVNVVKNSPEKARATSARRQPSQDSEDLFDASNQSADAVKQFNMSYHKISRRNKDGSNGTTHVTQLHDVPGFTTFIEEIKTASSQKANETQKSSPINSIHPKSDGRLEVKNSKKAYEQTFGSSVKSKSGCSPGGSFSDNKLFHAYENNVKSHRPKSPSHSFGPPYSENDQARSNGPLSSNSGTPEIDVCESDEELDVNSAAAASVAALKKAIEKAQESIRIAKKSVERKKEGLRGFPNKSFKDSLKVKEREPTDKNVEGKCGRVDAGSEVFDLMERKNACNGGVVGPDFKDSENLFVSRKVIDEMHGKILESARQCEKARWSVPELKESERVLVSRDIEDETTRRNQESVENVEASTWSFEQEDAEKGGRVGSAFRPSFGGRNILKSADYHESKIEVRRTKGILEEQGFINKLGAVEKSCEVGIMARKSNAEVGLHGLELVCIVDEETGNGLASSMQEEQTVLEKPQGFFKLVNFVKNLRGFVETKDDDKKVSDEMKDGEYKVRVNEPHAFVDDENKMIDSRELIDTEQKDSGYEKKLDKAPKQFNIREEKEEVCEEIKIEKAENKNGLGKDCDHDVSEKIFEEVSEWVENEIKEPDVSNEREKEDTYKEEAIDKWLDEVHELEMNEKGQTYVHDMDESEVRLQDDCQKGEETEKLSEETDANDEKDSEETFREKCERAGDDDIVTGDYIFKEMGSTENRTDEIEENREIEMPHFVYEEIFSKDFDGFNYDITSIAAEAHDTGKVETDDNNVETGQETNDGGRSLEVTEAFRELKDEKDETVEVSNRVQENEISEAAGWTSTEDDESEFEVKEVHGAFRSNEYEGKYGLGDKEVEVNEIGQTSEQSDFSADGTEALSNETLEFEEVIKEEVKIVSPWEERKLFPKRAHWDLEGSHLPNISEDKEQTVELKDEYKRSQYREKTEENVSRTMEDKKDKENELKKVEMKKWVRELGEARKKQMEREKERMAVERAIREARERAYAEVREKAERAAVERATAEVRQRVMAEAREKFEKVSAKLSSSEKASAEAKIRAERAAVERATAEARQRALQKAMSQKTTTSDNGIRQSSSSDLHGSSGTNSESTLRSKARLERHNRIMERASKALAEKEKRDLLAQIEQAERNRLAETLDAEVKRWSSGKEGNLRALLSTLQYILGSNSGWQPVSLTEIITTAAVKKAYRKATLAVHPDKLQQRGASIQQKYTCEKVFDLLKAAWNRFNSEER